MIGRHGFVLFVSLSMLAMVPLIGIAGPHIEARLFPVITDLEDHISASGPVVIVDSRFDKPRSCPVEHAIADFKPDNDAAVPALTSGSWNRAIGGASRLTRRYVLPDTTVFPGELRRLLFYRCHPFWLTPMRLAPVRVE